MHYADQSTSLSVEPTDMSVTSPGDVAVLSCQLHGTPPPRTRWYRDSDVITDDDDDDDDKYRYVVHSDNNGLSILEIHTASDDDAGYFRCEAGNGVGQTLVSRSARLSFNASTANHCMCS